MAMAGVMWSGVGIMLMVLAVKWMIPIGVGWDLGIGLGSIGLAFAAYRLGFSKIAGKNIRRLCEFPDKACFFAFQAWKSYIIIGVMISMGIFLRHLPIHKYYLSVPYMTIGGALFLSSLHYYAQLWRNFCRPE
jgi:hypothetical protein